jgi:hypothetical protein
MGVWESCDWQLKSVALELVEGGADPLNLEGVPADNVVIESMY